MSWFDTSKGFASLAKTALKEAQKQIDKALDIQEEEKQAVKDVKIGKLPGGANREKIKTEPSTPASPLLKTNDSDSLTNEKQKDFAISAANASSWGSFTGSFFDNPNGKEMVTVPPRAKGEHSPSSKIATNMPISDSKRQSVTSTSESVELLSSPTSPVSELTSPSDAALQASESVELITATTSELFSPELSDPLPESIIIIDKSKLGEEDDDDSLSYNTVMDSVVTSTSTELLRHSKLTSNTLQESKEEISEENMTQSASALCQSNSSGGTIKLMLSMEEVPYETQTGDSDSTQSFEEVHMQSSSLQSSTKDSSLCVIPREKVHSAKITSQNCSSSQNSNDEMETTTSSDIEIISNPNGDSSSTNSITRMSPLKQKKLPNNQVGNQTVLVPRKKGHYREPSEISILSEDSQSEVDKLVHRISELNEIIESRELRLLESERQNSALQQRNDELQLALDAMKNNNTSLELGEEYTQRLSVLEKKFQISIRERDALRIQINALKDELQTTIPKETLTQVQSENKTIIDELRTEGEKLSKEILQQSNIIKKLRLKEKTSDGMLKKNKEQILGMTEELERLKKTLNAKEEVERSQIEAVHKMSSEKRKLEEDNQQYCSKVEDLESKLATLQISFDAVKAELQQRQRQHTDLTRTAEEAVTAKKEKDIIKMENQEIALQLKELREKLRYSEQEMGKREQQLREENKELLRRLESAELRAETSTQEISLTTIPLVRQLESLQNTLSQRTNNWNKEEKVLLEKLDTAQTRLKSLEHVELKFKETIDLLQIRCRNLEEKLSIALIEEEKYKIALQQAQMDYSLKERELTKKISSLDDTLNVYKSKMEYLEEAKKVLEQKLLAKSESKQVSNPGIEECHIGELSQETLNAVDRLNDHPHRSQSPCNSFGKSSLEEAMGGSFDWQADDIDCISNSGHQAPSLVYGMNFNFMSANTTTLEHLQSMLKQRDGEISQLQWELSRSQAERNVLNEEISNLTMELETMKEKLQSYDTLNSNFAEVQHQYDALLQMYGEKVERTEELELDLVELKEAYKLQIDELLAQPNKSA